MNEETEPHDVRGALTPAQIGKVLHQEGTADEAMATSGQLARSLQDPARPVVFRIANQLFVEKSYPLVPAYLERMRRDFGAAAEPVDFKGAPERSRARTRTATAR